MKKTAILLFILLSIDLVVFAQQEKAPTNGAKIQFVPNDANTALVLKG